MTFFSTKARVSDNGVPPDSFLIEQIDWARTAPDEIFARNDVKDSSDIYNKVFPELGPYVDLLHRKAVMLEVERVLAGFESSWDFREGVDTSRLGEDTPENAEAGAWQVSYDSRHSDGALRALLAVKDITNGIIFQRVTKFDHPFAMEYVSWLMRHNTLHNGPLYKGDERLKIRKRLRGMEHSVYPWLSRAAVAEYVTRLKS